MLPQAQHEHAGCTLMPIPGRFLDHLPVALVRRAYRLKWSIRTGEALRKFSTAPAEARECASPPATPSPPPPLPSSPDFSAPCPCPRNGVWCARYAGRNPTGFGGQQATPRTPENGRNLAVSGNHLLGI